MDDLKRTALAALQHGDIDAAAQACATALAIDPDDIDILSTLGLILLSAQEFADAEAIFGKLVAIDPAQPSHWVNLGTSRRHLGKLDESLAAFSRAGALGESSADFLFNVGLTHIDRRDYEAGRAVLAKAMELSPNDAEIRYHYAVCCYERIRTEDALAALDDWERLSGLTDALTADIGQLLMELGEMTRAEAAIRRAAQTHPSDPRLSLTLAQMLERTNQIEEANRLVTELEANPDAASLGTDLQTLRARLAQRNSQHEDAVRLYRDLLSRCRDDHERHLLQYPLAKSLDALERYDEAFQTLLDAHRSQALLLKMTAPMASARGTPPMTVTRYGADPGDVARWTDPDAPPAAQSPIFIVAFPRSGTTLLELTLDAHPDLRSMDEQPFVQNALDEIIRIGIQYPEQLALLGRSDLNEIRTNYWQRVGRKVALHAGQRIVDKNPLNILRLPAIRRLFPNAPVLLAVRHPCDVLLSCFMQHFRAPEFALLCQDLATLALGYMKSIDFWYRQQAILAPRYREIRYENFVGDFEREVRALAEFLELPWNDALLSPQAAARSKGFISTPSYSQVVEPVNKKAVGRWRRYEKHFADILPQLEPLMSRWGYDGALSSNNR